MRSDGGEPTSGAPTRPGAAVKRVAVRNAAWLSHDVMVVTVELTTAARDGAPANGGRRAAAAGSTSVRVMEYGPSADGTRRLLVTMRVPSGERRRPHPIRGQTGDGRGFTIAAADVARSMTDLRTLTRESLVGLGPDDRSAALVFLLGCAGEPADPAPTRATSCPMDDGLSRGLHQMREALRERLTVGTVESDAGIGLFVDSILGIDDLFFYLEGWLWDGGTPALRLTAVSPEGCRVEILGHLFRRERPDVRDFFAASCGGGVTSRLGFLSGFTTPVPSRRPTGWVMEVEAADGTTIETAMPPVIFDARRVREKIVTDLANDGAAGDGFRATHAYPALRRLQERCRAGVEIVDVQQLGLRPTHAAVTVVVPLYGRIDLLEHQLAQFALDSEMRETDIVYVLDSPELAADFRTLAARAARLYDVPFRAVVLSENGGYATANNLGATLAEGRTLLLLNSDVLPEKPGWLSRLARFHESVPGIGALGCMLLYEDESLQHAGMYFERFADGPLWYNGHHYKGLHRTFPAANVARPVPAVTGACMMLDTALYRSIGGLSGQYLQGDYEDSDLCLRIAAKGLENWYTPDVALYHLEGRSYPGDMRRSLSEYNRWLHTHLWDTQITEAMERFAPRTHSSERPGRRAGERTLLGRRLTVTGTTGSELQMSALEASDGR